ncbi:hypothetical protein MNB_SV-13-1376 [hydrothermal vent metagenome]|uniref:HTH tetR-type domain-containing protein n=1 Tax=hydrothermal vent metagenome TaxID=652676 RepID=A0A1W1C582_9ZZZZ
MKTKNINKFNDLPQRQKKYAKTKIALLHALLKELEKKSLSEIMIKELAYITEVSEPTFFNYFDSKNDMLVYFIQLWSIDMNALAQSSELKCHSYILTIKDVFKQSSLQIVNHPQIILEIIAFQAQGLTLSSLFFGTSLLILRKSKEDYPLYLEAQLNQLFKGLTC